MLPMPLLFLAGSADHKFVRLGRAMAQQAGQRTAELQLDRTSGDLGAERQNGSAQLPESSRPALKSAPAQSVIVARPGLEAGTAQTGRFVEVLGAGHALHVERAELLARTLTDWLAGT